MAVKVGRCECFICSIAPSGAGEYVGLCCFKGAADSLTTGLSLEVAAQARANGVRPGLIYTDMHAKVASWGRVDRVDAAMQAERAAGRGGAGDRLATGVIRFLRCHAAAASSSWRAGDSR